MFLCGLLVLIGLPGSSANAGTITATIHGFETSVIDGEVTVSIAATSDANLSLVGLDLLGPNGLTYAFAMGDLGQNHTLDVRFDVSDFPNGWYRYQFYAHDDAGQSTIGIAEGIIANPGILDLAVSNLTVGPGVPVGWPAPFSITATVANNGDLGFGTADLWFEYQWEGQWIPIDRALFVLYPGDELSASVDWDETLPRLATEIPIRARFALPMPFTDDNLTNDEAHTSWTVVPGTDV